MFIDFKKTIDKRQLRCYNIYIFIQKGFDEEGVKIISPERQRLVRVVEKDFMFVASEPGERKLIKRQVEFPRTCRVRT